MTDRYGSDVLSTDWRAPRRGRAVEAELMPISDHRPMVVNLERA